MTLPRPEHWRDGMSAREVAVLVMFAGLGVFCVVWGLILMGRGDYLTAVVVGGYAVAVLSPILALVKALLGWVSPRAACDSGGTVLRVDRSAAWLLGVAAVAFISSGVLFVRYGPTGVLAIPMSRGQQLFFPILMALAVVMAVLGLGIVRRRRGFGQLRLTPDGFDVSGTANGSWADVVDITDEPPVDNPRGRIQAVMAMKDGPAQVISGLNGYTPRGRALYWMIRHYWLHPENRAELTNGRAIERLRNEDFEVE